MIRSWGRAWRARLGLKSWMFRVESFSELSGLPRASYPTTPLFWGTAFFGQDLVHGRVGTLKKVGYDHIYIYMYIICIY